MNARNLLGRGGRWVRVLTADEPSTTRLLVALTVFVALTFVLSVSLVPSRFLGVRVGRAAPRTVVAPVAVSVVDEQATAKLRDEAESRVGPQYVYDPTAIDRIFSAVDRFFERAAALSARGDLSRAAKLRSLRQVAPPGVGEAALGAALDLEPARLRELAAHTRTLLSALVYGRVTRGELGDVRDALTRATVGLRLTSAERGVVASVGRAAIVPTFVDSPSRRERLQKEAREAVPPVVLKRLKGEAVVRQGEIVTRSHLLLMRELGLTRTHIDPSSALGAALVVGLLMAAALAYLSEVERDVYLSTRDLVIVGLLMLVVALVGKLMLAVSPMLPVYVVPVAAAPMLVTLLLGPHIGVVAASGASVVLGGATQFSGETLLWSLITCLAAVFAMAKVTKRTNLYPAAATVMVAAALVAGAVTLFAGSSVRESVSSAAFGVAGGFLSTLLAVGLLPLLEAGFDITTDIRLADLINPNQPLLKELMLKAPGTYSHSTITANMAESAADAIGANPLLARAGAYYHDIGKLKRPGFFVENQFGQANPHDSTNPRLSSMVITAHVRDGVELAKEAHLPEEIIEIITQHHGTGVVRYFYQRAVEELGYQAVNEDDFRYEGERPQSPEAAIVMLADAVEAAVRALSKPTPQRIEQAARKVVQNLVDDGQLDESRLTMCDLDNIVRAFAAALSGMYHPRVEYPEVAVVRRDRKAASDGRAG